MVWGPKTHLRIRQMPEKGLSISSKSAKKKIFFKEAAVLSQSSPMLICVLNKNNRQPPTQAAVTDLKQISQPAETFSYNFFMHH